MSRCAQGTPRRELLEEEPGGDGAAAARPDVVQVGHVGLEMLAVLVEQGQLPDALAGRLRRRQQAVGQRLAIRHEPGAERAQRHHAGAGQGGHVDHLVGLDGLDGVAQDVGQGEAALGVGVADLDGRAVHGAQHVARAERGPRGHVLGGRDEAVHLDLRLQGGQRAHDAEHGRRPGHVVLHAQHALRALEVEAPGVEGDALADDGDALDGTARRAIREVDELRRLLAARGHPEEGPHPQLRALRAVEDLRAEPGRLGDALGHLGQVRGMHLVGRRIDQIAREPGGPREGLAGAHALGDLAGAARIGRDDEGLVDELLRRSRACSARRRRSRGSAPRRPRGPGAAAAAGRRAPRWPRCGRRGRGRGGCRCPPRAGSSPASSRAAAPVPR